MGIARDVFICVGRFRRRTVAEVGRNGERKKSDDSFLAG